MKLNVFLDRFAKKRAVGAAELRKGDSESQSLLLQGFISHARRLQIHCKAALISRKSNSQSQPITKVPFHDGVNPIHRFG